MSKNRRLRAGGFEVSETMKDLVIQAEQRDMLGKNANRRLRTTGKIPAVVYGHGFEAVSVAVDPKDIHRILHSESGHNTIFKLQLPDVTKDVLIRDYQLDPVKGHLLHADFQTVAMDEVMVFEVPIEAVGNSIGVKNGGILDIVLREIELECLPSDVPDSLEVDVTALDIGDVIRVEDLKFDSTKITLLSEPDLVVLNIASPAVEEEEEPVEEVVAEPEVIKKGKVEEAGEKE